MSDTSFIDLSTTFVRDFSNFYLKRNPFPSIGIPEDAPLITVDRERMIRQFRRMVADIQKENNSKLTVIVGEYGSGKSHLFKIFKNNVNTQLFNQDNGMIASYIKSPEENFTTFVLEFIDDIGEETFVNLAIDVVFKYLQNLSVEKLKTYIFNKDVIKQIQENSINYKTIIESLKSTSLIQDVRAVIWGGVTNKDVVNAFVRLALPTTRTSAWNWFSGDTFNKTQMDEINVSNTITKENALEVFLSIKQLFQNIGIKYVAIFIDELEKITFLTPRSQARYQSDIRRFIDSCPTNTMFYFAISPQQWEELTESRSALMRRLSGNWIFLEDFEKKDVIELIQLYLYRVRAENYTLKDVPSNIDPSLYPFTNDSIDTILDLTEGIVSSILLLCRKSLDYLHDNVKKYKYINDEVVKEAFKSRG